MGVSVSQLHDIFVTVVISVIHHPGSNKIVYSITVPYSSLSKNIQYIHQKGGKVIDVRMNQYRGSLITSEKVDSKIGEYLPAPLEVVSQKEEFVAEDNLPGDLEGVPESLQVVSEKSPILESMTQPKAEIIENNQFDDYFPNLKSKNPEIREQAIQKIAESCTDQHIDYLINSLSDDNIIYRRTIIKTLGIIGTKSVKSLGKTLLTNPDPTVRTSCAKALANIAKNTQNQTFPPSGLQALQQALYDSDPTVQITIISALEAIGKPAISTLQEALKIDNIAIRVAAIGALNHLDNPA